MRVTLEILSKAPRSANYSQPAAFTEAGECLTFDRHPGESWCFPRTHLVYCECAASTLRFRFPLFEVEVQTATPAAELLEAILTGTISVLHQAGIYGNNFNLPDHLKLVERITVHNLQVN